MSYNIIFKNQSGEEVTGLSGHIENEKHIPALRDAWTKLSANSREAIETATVKFIKDMPAKTAYGATEPKTFNRHQIDYNTNDL